MAPSLVAVSLLLLAAATGPVLGKPLSSQKTCTDVEIPLTVTSTNIGFGLPKFQTNFDVANFIDTVSSRNATTSGTVVAAPHNVTATYTISATFCKPKQALPAERQNTVLLATHGLAFDRSYWDPALDKADYSFVDAAIGRGYSVFYYDRLGVGKSSPVSGYVAQLFNQVAILTEITKRVKAGKYVGGKPDKVVLVGHSFGSTTSLNTAVDNVGLADGLVLTGFSFNSTFLNAIGFVEAVAPRIAAAQQPSKWAHLDTGYLTSADIYSGVTNFFKAPDYSQAVAKYADATKTPFAVTELITTGLISHPPYAFAGPVLLITGQYDFIFCTSDCDGALETPAAQFFGKAKPFKAISYPGAGHGLNLHLNAAGAFKEILDFVAASGL
ncbi:Alpha/Beta hydrolase protein [Lasiosphaeria hispida]|uniref:Alpha/Beta hydrolase protein n=1 Tax=Lasiosphaeria hispida TaxID=260671 RepID=A0AAJ0HJJ7_9PEZI|nr:Alpha/Beta hydrolase protein [Lasiosphaeria hispida]